MRKTLLVADDSPTIQRLVAETFADGDYDIVSVSNGDAAIRKLDEIHPHVILADVYMPGKNGFELCSYIKHHRELSETPVILLAGAFDVFDEKAALEAGAASSITKPFEPQMLVDLVASVIAAAAERAASRATAAPSTEESDLLGLDQLFKPAGGAGVSIGDEDLERIADRVLQKVSTQAIESVAWNVVPDIAEKIIREEVKRARSNET
jgi:DNA-binding response OmpR family regulator